MAVHIYEEIGENAALAINGVTLENVIGQVNNQPEGDLHIKIKSIGGSEQEGTDIYNYLKSLNRKVVTYADGNVDSIATKILLAGDIRIGFKGISTSLIHTVAYPTQEGAMLRVDDLTYLKEEGESLNKNLAKFYADKTGNTIEAFEPLMRDETELKAEQMLALGFITELREQPLRAVAFKKQNHIDMSKETVTKEQFEKKMNGFEALLKKVSDFVKPEAVALVIQDANGIEIDFPDVTEDGTPEVGSKATVDGKAASGEYVLPSGETYVFTDGALTEIKPEEAENEEMQALKDKNTELEKQISEMQAQNKKAEKENSEIKETALLMKKEISEIKEMAGSAFNYNPDQNKPDDADGKPDDKTSRSLFKKED